MIQTTSLYYTTCAICVKVRDVVVRIFDAFIEARRLQAAMATAQHLKAYNRDYRNMSLGEIVNQIIDETK
jgi:hypothetical protein